MMAQANLSVFIPVYSVTKVQPANSSTDQVFALSPCQHVDREGHMDTRFETVQPVEWLDRGFLE